MHAGDKARDQLTCDVMNSELTELMQQEHFRKLKVYIHRLKETLQIITFSLIDCCWIKFYLKYYNNHEFDQEIQERVWNGDED